MVLSVGHLELALNLNAEKIIQTTIAILLATYLILG